MCASALGQDDILDARTNFGIGDEVIVTGIVTNDGSLGSVRYIQDESAGIAIYPGFDWGTFPEPQIGDEITATGEISEFNGLLEVGPDLSSVVVNSSGNELPEPLVITANQMDEDLEGQLITINNATFFQGGQIIQGNSTYDFTASGETGTVYFRTSNELVGEVLTSCPANITGVLSQFSFNGTDGYQLLLRDSDDFEALSNICISSLVEQENITTSSFNITWTTDAPGDATVTFGTSPESLDDEVNDPTVGTDHSISLTNLTPGTIYYIQAMSSANGETAMSQVLPFATVSESSGEMLVYFNGSVDNSVATDELAINLGANLADTLAAYITRAENTLDIAVYNINNSVVVDAINTAQENGVQIRYIAQGTNANLGIGNFNAGIPVLYRQDDEGSGMHNKFCLIDAESTDNARVISGSTNWTNDNLVDDDNNMVIIQDESLAKAYTLEFNEMWGSDGPTFDEANSKFGSEKTINTPKNFIIGGSAVELYFSPTDGTTNAIVEAIETIEYDHHFALLSFTRDEIAEAQIAENSIFVNMNGIIDQINGQGSEYETLLDAGIPVYSGEIHHKYAIIDHSQPLADPIVITGSHNWSSSAENVNDENTLIIHDARIANLFWQEYSARLAESNTTVEEADFNKKMNVYPNPAQEMVTLQIDGLNEQVEVSLLDLAGKIVSSFTMNSNRIDMPVSQLTPGVYIVQVIGESVQNNAKLTVR